MTNIYEKTIIKYCDDKPIKYLKNNLSKPSAILDYYLSYLNLMLKEIKINDLNNFFERDLHSFQPFEQNAFPLSINKDTSAFDLFISSLNYLNTLSSIKNKEYLIPTLNLFKNFNLQIKTDISSHRCCHNEDCNLCQGNGLVISEYSYIKNYFKEVINKTSNQFYKKRDEILKNTCLFMASNIEFNFEFDLKIKKEIKIINNIKNFFFVRHSLLAL